MEVDIKKSMLALWRVKKHKKILNDFAQEEFEKFLVKKGYQQAAVWFNGCELIDKTTVRIKYQYGGGTTELDGYFDVNVEELETENS